MTRFQRSFPSWFVVVLLLAMASFAQAAMESRIYKVNNRTAEDIAGQIRQLYGDGQVRVTAQGQQLVVRGDAATLDEAGRLIQTLDVAPAQMRITVRSRQTGSGKSSGGGVSVNGNQVSVQAERKVTTTRSQQERSVVVQGGQSAHITQGQVRTIPVAIQGGRNPAAILQQVETRSGFVVSPQVISDQTVELTIVSFENDPEDDIQGYETEAVMTMRRVSAGEWVELGSTRESRNVEKSGITYQVGGDSRNNQVFEVRVEVM
jgi:type II secretory pathway component GspD/PulD (secretin)